MTQPPAQSYRTQAGQLIRCGAQLGKGGEGIVYDIPQHPGQVLKIYHPQHVSAQLAQKLLYMVQNPPDDPTIQTLKHVSIAWPTEVVYAQQQVVGYMMPKLGHADELTLLIHPKQRAKKHPGMDHRYLYRAARNLASAVDALHRKGYVVGDMNERNILFTQKALISVVDCDSMQVIDSQQALFPCRVGVPEYLAPELHGCDLAVTRRSSNEDNFTLAVLVFKLLMQGFHPFQGVSQSTQATGEQSHVSCMQQGIFPYLPGKTYTPPPAAPALSVLPGLLRQLFTKAFTTNQRPSAREWANVLTMIEQRLVNCANDARHYHPSDGRCVLCEVAQNVRTHGVIQTQAALPPPRAPKQTRATTPKKPAARHAPPRQVPPQPVPPSPPVPVAPPPTPVPAAKVVSAPAPAVATVTAAAQYSVAVRQDGSLVVWGDPAFQRIPANLDPVAHVWAGSTCAVAVCRNGSVVAWGPQPIAIPANLPPVTRVVVGHQGVLAISAQQKLLTWDQSLQWRELAMAHIVAIAVGGKHTVVLDRDGNVRAWGDNGLGQTDIPLDSPIYRAVFAGHTCTMAMRKNGALHIVGGPPELHRHPPHARNAQDIAIGSQHALAVTNQGDVISWGDVRHPTMRVPSSGNARMQALALADNHILALRSDGKVVAWGNNDAKQCDVPPDVAG